MKNEHLIIILGICTFLTSCFKNTDDQQREFMENKEEIIQETTEKHSYGILHDKIMLSNDDELIKLYKIVQTAVLKGDYRKAVALANKFEDKNMPIAVYYAANKLREFTSKINNNPDTDNSDAYNNRGTYRYEFNDKKGALQDINKALEINPYYYTAYMNRASIERNNKDYEKAANDYDMAIKNNPYNPMPYAEKGFMQYQRNMYNEAIENFTKAIEFDGKNAYYLLNRGFAYYKLGNKEKSKEDAKKAEKLIEKNKNVWYKIAQIMKHIDSPDKEAIKYVENKLLLNENKHSRPLFTDAIMPQKNDFKYAKEDYDILFNTKTNDEEIIKYRKAYKDLIKGNYDKAQQVFNYKDSCKGKGNLCLHTDADNLNQKYSFAVSSFRRHSELLSNKGDSYLVWHYIGIDKLNIYDKKGAIKAFDNAIKLNPYDSEGYYFKALIELDNGDYKAAAKDMDLAIKYNPYNAELYFNIAGIYRDLYLKKEIKTISGKNTVDEVISNFDKAINLVPKESYILTRGLFYTSMYVNDRHNYKLRNLALQDINLAKEKYEKYRNTEINFSIRDALNILNEIDNKEVEFYILFNVYYSLDEIVKFCKGQEPETYLELADDVFSIFNYKEVEKKNSKDDISFIKKEASNLFSYENQTFNDKKDFRCSFIENSPYDVVVDNGLLLMNWVSGIKDALEKSDYRDSYNMFKKTIISYIPKMMVNDKRKDEIMKQAKKFK